MFNLAIMVLYKFETTYLHSNSMNLLPGIAWNSLNSHLSVVPCGIKKGRSIYIHSDKKIHTSTIHTIALSATIIDPFKTAIRCPYTLPTVYRLC